MDNNNRNSAGGNSADLDRILDEAASKASRSSSPVDPTIEKARSEINARADSMLKEIEERRARRQARQLEIQQQLAAEEEAKARRMARIRASEAAAQTARPSAGSQARKPVPTVSSSDSVFSNQQRPSARAARQTENRAVRRRPAEAPAQSADRPSKRQTIKPGQTQVMPKITEAVPQRPSTPKDNKAAPQRGAAARQDQDVFGSRNPSRSGGSAPRQNAERNASVPEKSPKKKAKTKKKDGEINMLKEIRDWVVAIAIAIVLALLIRNFVFTLVKVQGASMQPTLHENDRLYVNRFFYKPEKGDVVIFEPASDPDRPYVKRVIATEGDTVYIDFETGDVYVNDQLLDEPYIKEKTTHTGSYIMELIASGRYSKDNPIVVEKDKIFVMGDNRNNSKDSRELGQVPEDEIIGGAVFRFWPIGDFGSVAYPIETSYLVEDKDHNFTFVS